MSSGHENNTLLHPDGLVMMLVILGLGASSDKTRESIMRDFNVPSLSGFLQEFLSLYRSPEIKFGMGMFLIQPEIELTYNYYNQISGHVDVMKPCKDHTPENLINTWIARFGGGFYINEKIINSTQMMLVNMFTFEDHWNVSFDLAPISTEYFNGEMGISSVQMMHRLSEVHYHRKNGITAIRFGFRCGAHIEIVMGLGSIDLSTFGSMEFNYVIKLVRLSMPKFTQELLIDISKLLIDIGYGQFLSVGSMNAAGNVHLSSAYQRIKVVIHERGVRQSQYLTYQSIEPDAIVKFNRTFYYRIVNDDSTLIVGKYDGDSQTLSQSCVSCFSWLWC